MLSVVKLCKVNTNVSRVIHSFDDYNLLAKGRLSIPSQNDIRVISILLRARISPCPPPKNQYYNTHSRLDLYFKYN